MSWHTLARKHKKYGIEDEVEPLTVPGEPDYMGSFSTLASSRQQLNLKVGLLYWLSSNTLLVCASYPNNGIVHKYMHMCIYITQRSFLHTHSFSTEHCSLQHEEARYEERRESEDDQESDINVRPVVGLAMKRVPSVEQSLEGEDSQLDDLMFMLKTQNYPHDEEAQPPFPESPQKLSASEHMELRRISIADTHL